MLPVFGPKKGLWLECRNPLRLMVRLAGFEPATYGLEVRCSIQLSYRRKFSSFFLVTWFEFFVHYN